MKQKIAIWAPSHNFVSLYLRIWGMYQQSKKNLLSSPLDLFLSHWALFTVLRSSDASGWYHFCVCMYVYVYMYFVFIIGSKSLYCIYFGATWRGFSLITSPNSNLPGWNLEYKWGATLRTHTRKRGKIAPGVPPKDATTCFVFMAALCNRAGHYMFALWFLSSFFYSSPNVSGRRLDVYHTSTHGVALERI